MGYYMSQTDCSFSMTKEDAEKALQAIKDLAGKETYGDHFSWVDTKRFLEAKTFKEATEAWRWSAEEDKEGNINGLWFQGDKSGDEDTLFDAIAPFVKEGSFIEMSGEDSTYWRWKFTGGKCIEVYGHVVFDDEEGR